MELEMSPQSPQEPNVPQPQEVSKTDKVPQILATIAGTQFRSVQFSSVQFSSVQLEMSPQSPQEPSVPPPQEVTKTDKVPQILATIAGTQFSSVQFSSVQFSSAQLSSVIGFCGNPTHTHTYHSLQNNIPWSVPLCSLVVQRCFETNCLHVQGETAS
jgi:hypothetical protein